MMVSWPLSAPAWPPDTGASTKARPSLAASAAISRATTAEVVVWSTTTPPGAMAGSASPTTWRTSSSLPTQSTKTSAPIAASAAVAPARPPWAATQRAAFSGERL